MTKIVQTISKSEKNKKKLHNELKMFVNQRLFEKNLISEDMYLAAKDILLKQAI